MIAVAKKPATYDDLIALPENVIGEILDGELHVQPRPAFLHAGSASNLGSILGMPFGFGRGGPGGWILLDEPELHLGRGPDVLVPDLAGWRRERMPERPDVPFVTLAPDWVCEILSPSTMRVDRTKKLEIYARERVAHAWLIDPSATTLEVYRLAGANWMLVACFGGDAVVRAEPFDAIELELGLLFAR